LVAVLVATLAVRADAQGGPGMIFTPVFPTVGQTFTATMLQLPAPAMSATWWYQIAIPGGCTSPVFATAGSTQDTTIIAQIPGIWTVGGQFILVNGTTVNVSTNVAIRAPDRRPSSRAPAARRRTVC
jgi:hypothetical protein